VSRDIEDLKAKVLNESSLDITINEMRELPDVSNKIIYFQQLS
jgi:hypothetical protein